MTREDFDMHDDDIVPGSMGVLRFGSQPWRPATVVKVERDATGIAALQVRSEDDGSLIKLLPGVTPGVWRCERDDSELGRAFGPLRWTFLFNDDVGVVGVLFDDLG